MASRKAVSKQYSISPAATGFYAQIMQQDCYIHEHEKVTYVSFYERSVRLALRLWKEGP